MLLLQHAMVRTVSETAGRTLAAGDRAWYPCYFCFDFNISNHNREHLCIPIPP